MHIKLAKLFFLLLFYYFAWYQYAIAAIPRLLIMLGLPMIFFIFLHYYNKKLDVLKALTKEVGLWLLFALTSFIFGIFVAENQQDMISSILTLCQFIIVFTAILIIADEDQKVDFFAIAYVILAILCALTVIFFGEDFGHGRISLKGRNPNFLGLLLCNGIICILYFFNAKKALNIFFSASAILLFLYVIILTGSRRSFLAAALLIVLWLVFVLRDVLRGASI